MKTYYQIAFKHEVWGNEICKIRFFDGKNNLIYARNVFCHSLKGWGEYGYFHKIEGSNRIVIYEYLRPTIAEIAILDFTNHMVYRMSIDTKFELSSFLEILETNTWPLSNDFRKDKFCLEKIHLPLFRFWGKKHILFG